MLKLMEIMIMKYLSDISLWIPIAKPSLETDKILSSLLVSKSNFLCGWNALNCYRSNLWKLARCK
jgi:hypothetical protein